MNRYFETLWKAAHGVKGFSEVLIDYILHNGDGGNTEMYDTLNAISANHSDGRFTSLDLMKLSGAVDLSNKGIKSLTSSYNGKTYYPLDFLLRATSIDLSANDLIKDIVFKQNGGFLNYLSLPIIESLKMETPRFVYINNPVVSENEDEVTTITRKVYDADSEVETELGIPYTEVTETFKGKDIACDGLTLHDVWNLADVNITDNHSSGVDEMKEKISKVQLEERCIPRDFGNVKINALPIGEDGCVNFDDDTIQLIEEGVAVDSEISIEGLSVKRVWKVIDGSYLFASSSVLMDYRTSMEDYSVDDADAVIFKNIQDNEEIRNLVGLSTPCVSNIDVGIDSELENQTDINKDSYLMIALLPKINLDSIMGVLIVKLGIDAGYPYWMVCAYKNYDIPFETSISLYAEWKDYRYGFDELANKSLYLVGDGSAYINTKLYEGENRAYIKAYFKLLEKKDTGFVCFSDGYIADGLFGYTTGNTSISFQIIISGSTSGGAHYHRYILSLDIKHVVEICSLPTNVYWIVDGAKTYEGECTGTTPTSPLYFFKSNFSIHKPIKAKLGVTIVADGDMSNKHVFVPFYRDGVYGMLDALSDTFYKNSNTSGTFTTVIE